MFTGLVETVQPVASARPSSVGMRLTVEAGVVIEDARIGDSVAVNGVCLTINEIKGQQLSFDVMAETVRASTTGALQVGRFVNLERATPAGGRFGGHMVQGHVDGIGVIEQIVREKGQVVIWISGATDLVRNLIAKGSVAVDGVSLTVVSVQDNRFNVSIIPTTLQETNLGTRKPGDKVNLEADMIGKWINKRIDAILEANGHATLNKLHEQGF